MTIALYKFTFTIIITVIIMTVHDVGRANSNVDFVLDITSVIERKS